MHMERKMKTKMHMECKMEAQGLHEVYAQGIHLTTRLELLACSKCNEHRSHSPKQNRAYGEHSSGTYKKRRKTW